MTLLRNSWNSIVTDNFAYTFANTHLSGYHGLFLYTALDAGNPREEMGTYTSAARTHANVCGSQQNSSFTVLWWSSGFPL